MKKDPTGFKKGPKKFFPAWRFRPGYAGPDAAGREDPTFARIFQKAEDVPEGWYVSPQEANDAAEAPAPVVEKPLTPPAPNKGKGKAKAPPADERAANVAKLTAAGYDPKELETATDAEIATALKGLTNGADH